ncbi:hypothetical protein BGZ60DRAFT_400297 [Tricladium varicosporioides]|nr:hypothetical protein BGZ60DRAFT_400297 [Hymenoscyphus varicosporioides]
MESTRNAKRALPTTTQYTDIKKRKVNTENAWQEGETNPITNDENATPAVSYFYRHLERGINENGTIVPEMAVTYKPLKQDVNTVAKKINGMNESRNTTALKLQERDPNVRTENPPSTKAVPETVHPQTKAVLETSKPRESESIEAKSSTPVSLPPGRDTPWPRPSTPGRVGPVLPRTFGQEYKIAPFKGPKGHKVRKTFWEKEEEYKQHILADPTHCFHEMHVCFKKGPNGSPTCDKAGFELDYWKVADWMKPRAYNKRGMVKGMEKRLSSREEEAYKLRDIFFEPGAKPEGDYHEWSQGVDFWKDRVSKDLQIPWHHISVKEFQMWEKKGFQKAKKGEYQNPTQEEKNRMNVLHEGCNLRK